MNWNRFLDRAMMAAVVMTAAAGAAACGSADAQDAEKSAAVAPQMVTVTARDFSFEAPAEIPAGPTTFQMVNAGQALHHVQLVKLEEGKTVDDLLAAMKAGGPPPAWARNVGGPNAPDPGATSNATVVLEPGNYAMLCFVDIPGGVPHVMRGMVKPLRVTAPTASAGVPAHDVVMTLSDYTFALSKPLTAGRHVIRVENAARQPHEVEIVRLAPGKTAEDVAAWMRDPQGPPPVSAIGGVAGMDSGMSNTFEVDLEPGKYLLLCFVPDAGDGKPHLAHGMIREITIE